MVTGGSGYIGMNLIRHLQKQDCTYINYDLRLGHDLLDERGLYQQMKGCDVVVHLAALPGVSYCEKNIDEAIEINLLGTCNVVRAANTHEISVILMSSFAAKTDNVYGLTKRLAEKVTLQSSLNVVLRAANVYGGIGYLQKKRSAIASFVKHKKAGVMATIYGDGTDERDFVHVDDVCNAVILAFGAPSGIYEICTRRYTSIQELADMVGVEYEFTSSREVDVHKVAHDAVEEALGWKPTIKLEDGLKELLK